MQEMTSHNWSGKANVEVGENFPATFVSWNDATAFCQRLTDTDHKNGKLPAGESYRLPTDAEWEYACRAGTTTAFSFGEDESKLGEYAWFSGNTVGKKYAHKVGKKKPNPWGLHDMHGNVWEWCSDWYDGKLIGGVDPIGPEGGSTRVFRGGCWGFTPGRCRSANRGDAPSNRVNRLGFRVARSQSVQ
jgi:formylglycine-generating enzyme required for sulfatase activity